MKILANNCYKPCSGYKVANIIRDGLKDSYPLSDNQYYKLTNFLGNRGILGNLDMEFQFYTWEIEKPQGSFLWRLTIPFYYIITIITLLTIYPLHWILTGKQSFDPKNKVVQLMSMWDNKLFNRK